MISSRILPPDDSDSMPSPPRAAAQNQESGVNERPPGQETPSLLSFTQPEKRPGEGRDLTDFLNRKFREVFS